MRFLIVITFILSFSVLYSQTSQLVIENPVSDSAIIAKLIGSGVTVSNVNFLNESNTRGVFIKGDSINLGINEGVVMATGLVSEIPQSNGTNVSSSNPTQPTDSLVSQFFPSISKFDLAMIEFDFIPSSDRLNFNFVFASEEYPEYVCSGFNDIFGFILSEVALDNSLVNSVNLAKVPNTTDDITINTINNGNPYNSNCIALNSQYFVDNYTNTNPYFVFDGYTTKLPVNIQVIQDKKYHIKMFVADVSDAGYNSAVFIEGNSFSAVYSITGEVFHDKDTIGVKDPNDLPVSFPVTVNLRDSANFNTILQTVTTDTNGMYNFYVVDKSKTYFVDVNDVSYYTQTTTRYRKVKFSSGSSTIANVDFGMAQCTISGKVYEDTDQNGQYNSGDQLFVNRKVLLYSYGVGRVIDSAYTDVSGHYSFLVECSCKTDFPYAVITLPNDGETIKQPSNGQPIYVNLFTCPNTPTTDKDFGIYVPPPSSSCAECIPSFSPLPCKDYLLSAWVKEDFVKNKFPDTYMNSGVKITFNNGTDQTIPLMRPTGPIVDGWQRIEQKFTVPCNAQNIQVKLVNTSSSDSVYFDDVRIHPFRSNMKSFVYNPSTQKVEAILDENNYATLYEYDDEGILIRVKKETERGVMTIKESRNNQSKR